MSYEEKVSAVVLTKNEEDNLRYCLRSLKWCDEIIVVDSDSQDATLDIALDQGARVIQEESADGKFDHLRNFGVEEASNDWIFVLDADEVCPRGLADILLEEAKKGQFDAFEIPRKNYSMDEIKLSAIYPDYQMRFHRKSSVHYGKELHTFINIADEANVKELDPEDTPPIIHFAVQTVKDHFNSLNRYSSIRASNEFENYSIFRTFFKATWNTVYALGRNFVYKKGYKKPHQTALSVFTPFIFEFMLYFKKWQINEKGTDEEVLDKINDIREKEANKYDEENIE